MHFRDQAIVALTFAAAIGTGTVGGVLFAFSSFVMAALERLPAPQGTAAMNAINVTVVNPGFMLAFIGTAALCAVLVFATAVSLNATPAKLVFAAALIYLIGCIGVTMTVNVPLNDQLAAFASGSADQFWNTYVSRWTLWNHVRTGAAILSATLLTLALLLRR